jgi:NTP pyrophosphatase (non-canonical NTP hydrolase)
MTPTTPTEGHAQARTKVFDTLSEANAARQVEWANGEAVSLLFRATELGGECGEVLNVCKKIERERMGWRGSRASLDDLADELADVVICADLLAATEGINLRAAIIRKFNATSEKVGLPHRLKEPPQ